MRLADGAAGNPLYVTELVAALPGSVTSSLGGSHRGPPRLRGRPCAQAAAGHARHLADRRRDTDAARRHLAAAIPHAKQRVGQPDGDRDKIAAFVEEGLSNPEIAAKLLLSRRTVATHVSHILKKLDVNSRTDIAREAALRTITSR